MNKRLIPILCLILACVSLLFVSCGNNDTDTSSDYNTDLSTDTDTEDSSKDTSGKVDDPLPDEGPSEFTITFELGNGEENIVVTVEKGKTILARNIPQDPTREGYTFDAWYFNNKIWIPSAMEENITVLAKWKPNNNSVVFDANGGDGEMPLVSLPAGEKTKLKSNSFKRTGYEFVGWSTTPDGEVEIKDRGEYTMGTAKVNTLYAVWTPFKYSIEYQLVNGIQNKDNPSTYTVLDDYKFHAPTRPGYTFTGWTTDDGTPIEGTQGLACDILIVANWILERHTITYNGVEEGEHSNPVDFDAGDEFTFENPERKGYKFLGWYTDEKYTNEITGIDLNTVENLEIYAKFEIISYSISYAFEENGIINSAENIDSYDIKTNFSFLDPTFEKDGYEFDGWYLKGTNTAITEIVAGESTGDISLVGKLKLIEYKIIYANNQGIEMPAGTKTTYTIKDSAQTINIPNISKWGYTFHGWYSDYEYQNKITTISIDPKEPKDITVFAKFSCNEYTITYIYGNKPNVVNPNSETYSVLSNITFEEAISGEYKTLGWYLDANFTKKIESTNGKAENLTIYAKWASANNQPTILATLNDIDTIYANAENAKPENGYALFDGATETTGIYSDGNLEWYGKENDILTIEFKNELDVYSMYAYCLGNYTFSQVSLYNASGEVVRSQNLLANNSEASEQILLFEETTSPIKVKKIEIKITSLKWVNNPRTHKISELEIFIANPDYIPE